MDLPFHAPSAEAEKFCRTFRPMPGGSASSEQSAMDQRNARIIPLLLWQYKRRGGHAFGPPSIEEGGPRRTRRLRHGLSQNTERPCSNTCKGFRLHEILPPDVLRHSRSQAVVRTAEGEVNILSCCLLRTLCDFQMSGFPALHCLALVDKLVMNSIFIVNMFFQRAKNFF